MKTSFLYVILEALWVGFFQMLFAGMHSELTSGFTGVNAIMKALQKPK